MRLSSYVPIAKGLGVKVVWALTMSESRRSLVLGGARGEGPGIDDVGVEALLGVAELVLHRPHILDPTVQQHVC